MLSKLAKVLVNPGVKMPSYWPFLDSPSFKYMIGPLSVSVLMIRVDNTTKSTEQKARIKLHFERQMSREACLQRNRQLFILL